MSLFNILVATVLAISLASDLWETTFRLKYLHLSLTRLILSLAMLLCAWKLQDQASLCACLAALGAIRNHILMRTIEKSSEHLFKLLEEAHEALELFWQEEPSEENLLRRLELMCRLDREFNKLPNLNFRRMLRLQKVSFAALAAAALIQFF